MDNWCYNNSFVMKSYLENNIKKYIENKMILIAIGKEIVFEYSDNFYKMDKNSHNIDRWILFKEYHNSKYIKMYNKYEVTEPTRDGRIDMIVKKQV